LIAFINRAFVTAGIASKPASVKGRAVSANRNTADETKEREGTAAFMGNLVPALCVFFIGYPLGRATIRAVLLG